MNFLSSFLDIVLTDIALTDTYRYPPDIKILGWCLAGSVLPHGEKVPL